LAKTNNEGVNLKEDWTYDLVKKLHVKCGIHDEEIIIPYVGTLPDDTTINRLIKETCPKCRQKCPYCGK